VLRTVLTPVLTSFQVNQPVYTRELNSGRAGKCSNELHRAAC